MYQFVMTHLPDLIFLFIVIITALDGLRKGIVGMIITAVAFVAAVVAAKIYSPEASGWLYYNFIEPGLISQMAAKINEASSSGSVSLASALPEYITSTAQSMNVDLNAMLAGIADSGVIDSESVAKQVLSTIAQPVLIPAIRFAVFSAGTVVLSGVFSLVLSPFNYFAKLPVIKEANKTIGFVLGILKGLFIDFILACAAVIVSTLTAGSRVSEVINSSIITGFVSSFVNK